jgi:hypothetical protein
MSSEDMYDFICAVVAAIFGVCKLGETVIVTCSFEL